MNNNTQDTVRIWHPITHRIKTVTRHPEIATCGTCGRSWDDSLVTSITPAPSGRCPFEHTHGHNAPKMTPQKARRAKTREEARDRAIEWQNWESEQSLSYGEILEWQDALEYLAKKYDLLEEFTENGIL